MEKKINKNQKIVLLVVGALLLVLILIFVIGLFLKPKNELENPPAPEEPITDMYNIQQVEPTEAETMYKEVASACTGALVWNLDIGQTVQIDDLSNMNTCHTDDYYSKMIGYTYDLDNNVLIHVNVLKKVDNELRKLDDTRVAEFSEEGLNDALNLGTTYEYVYQPNGDNYKLIEVKLMALPTTE